jgi:hypothetical protein
MLAGVLAGRIVFVFAYRFEQPQVDLAIAVEELMAAAAEAEDAPLVTRETQATAGLVGYEAAIGGIFASALFPHLVCAFPGWPDSTSD